MSEKYRKQALAQIETTNSSPDNKQGAGNVTVGQEKVKRHYGCIDRPVTIHYTSKRKRLADSDGNFTKYFTDAIVTAGLLVDDSPKFVKGISHSQEKSKEERTVIEIYVASD